jgi:EAL domain-containing protein (putative c-di-GMP-specific phosphodiesterase class I)
MKAETMTPESVSQDVQRFMQDHEIAYFLRPVVSIKKAAVAGVEPAVHGHSALGLLSEEALRRQAASRGLALEFDRHLRQSALERFRAFEKRDPSLFLFLNFNASLVDQGVVGSGRLVESVDQSGVSRNRVVISLLENEARDSEALARFAQRHRDMGFLIALAGTGSGHSNLSRIVQTRPDILRIGPPFTTEEAGEFHRTEILRALTTLGKNIGALMVAEGLRSDEEALRALEFGADMLQGDALFGRLSGPDLTVSTEKIRELAKKHVARSSRRAQSAVSRNLEHDDAFRAIAKSLSIVPFEAFSDRLPELAQEFPAAECLYVLDPAGVQITDTVSLPGKLPRQRQLFQPAEKGADHSHKEYYYLLIDTFVQRYHTAPYVSLASGRLCRTLSGLIKDEKGQTYILCVDFPSSATSPEAS